MAEPYTAVSNSREYSMKHSLLITLSLLLFLPNSLVAKSAEEYALEIEQLRAKGLSPFLSSLTREAVIAYPEDGRLLRMRGLYLFEKKRYRSAERSFAKLVKAQPNLAIGHLFLLRCQIAQKTKKSTIDKTMQNIRSSLAGQSRHLAEAGNILIRSKKMATAFKHFVALLDGGSPNRWLYHLKLGQMYCLVGEWKEATSQLAKSQQLEPEYGLTYYYLGKAWERLGKKDYAQSLYAKALEVGLPQHLTKLVRSRLRQKQ